MEHKRAEIHDLPQGDDMFLILMLGVSLCSMVAMVGVGFYMTRGNHQHHGRADSPYTDISPSFQSSKLAFSSVSPEDKKEQKRPVEETDWRGGPASGRIQMGSRA